MLKTYESNLIQLKYEDLLHFLINDLIKSGFFQTANYEKFRDTFDSISIKNNLINNLENENIQDHKIKESEQNK